MITAKDLRQQILEKLPEGTVKAEHTERHHFYRIVPKDVVYPSVTGKLQLIKDEGLMNYKMNRAIEYIAANRSRMALNEGEAMAVFDEASKESERLLKDAGDIGTLIHDAREQYFKAWIETGVRPPDARAFIPPGCVDRRAVSGMRGIEKFCQEWKYEPVVSELYVYSERWQTAGALDDIGLIDTGTGPEIVLMDLKTSNRFKSTYFFQVAMYWSMFSELTGITPQRVLILKASKETGKYEIEELTELPKLVEYVEHMLKMNEAVAFIEGLRKDNQKNVVTL